MTPYEKKKLVKQQINHWINLLGLNKWNITFKWHNQPDKKEPGKMAETYILFDYYRAVMHVYLLYMNSLDEINYTVVHELCHLILARYDWFVEQICEKDEDTTFINLREQTCETLTWIILNAYNAGGYRGKD